MNKYKVAKYLLMLLLFIGVNLVIGYAAIVDGKGLAVIFINFEILGGLIFMLHWLERKGHE